MKQPKLNPPKVAQKLLLLFLRNDLAEEVTGDLDERFDRIQKSSSSLKAKIDYWFQVINYLRPFALRKGRLQTFMHYAMFQNYFKIGWRNIVKYKAFSAINVFGLALAMSVCMLIILMLADQYRFDKFNTKGDRIYRVLTSTYATSPEPLATAIKSEYAVAEETTRLTPGPAGDAVYNDQLTEMRGYFADPAFFKIFSFELERGNATTALQLPNSVVITQKIAAKLFGDEDPLGKSFDFADRKLSFPLPHTGSGAPPANWGSFTVTGVIDESKYKSHLEFDVLMSESSRQALESKNLLRVGDGDNWEWYFRTYSFVLLREDKTEQDLVTALKDLVTRKYANIKSEQTKDIAFIPQKLADVQLGLSGNDTTHRLPMIGYYFLIILASVIMLTACFNYTNLSVARALTRAKEIGVRKVTGAGRRSIVFQFLSESMMTSLLALIMAVGLLYVLTPSFKNLWVNNYLNLELPSSPGVYLIFVGFALLIGLIAGAYPAFYLSKYNPIKALKNPGVGSRGKLGMRKVLSVSQFVISLFFITTSILVFNQFKYFIEFDYGFKTENIVNVELQGVKYDKLKNALSTIPEITMISATDIIPGMDKNNGMDLIKPGTKEDYVRTAVLNTDENFLSNLSVNMLAGKTLSPTDSGSSSILISHKALEKLGFQTPHDAVGQLIQTRWDNQQVQIAGVFEDFTYRMLINTRETNPIVLRNWSGGFEYLNVKIASPDVKGTLAKIEQEWKKIDPVHPLKYEFFDSQLASMYQGVFDLISILGFIAFLAIVISCLGLLGMATYTSERRTKEVGIRKVLGAPDWSIAKLLSKEFMNMLLLAIVIGAPLSYLINNLWLRFLTHRVEFGFGTVIIGSLILVVLGILTVGSQTLRASKTNPVESLKSE